MKTLKILMKNLKVTGVVFLVGVGVSLFSFVLVGLAFYDMFDDLVIKRFK